MKWPGRISAALLISLACSLYLNAQEPEFAEGRAFFDRAGQSAAFFRGRQAMRYNIVYEGTYFWYSPEFAPGSIMWDGKQYDGLNLNIDAVKQEAQVYPPGTVTAVVMDRNHIDWLEMGGIRYVNLSKKGYQVNEGFYEVMDQSPEGTVYRQLVKTVKLDLTDAEKKLHASYYFSSAETYYLERGGTLQELRRRRAQRLLRNPRGRSIASAVKPRTKALQPIVPHQQDLLLPADLPAQPVQTALPSGSGLTVDGKEIYATLPPDYFSSGQKEEDDELLRLLNAGNEMVTFANKVYEVGQAENARGDRAVVHGTVRDVLSGEPLAGVVVSGGKGGTYALTDNDGNFRLSLPLGDNSLDFSGFSLEDLHLSIHVNSDGGLDVVMKEKVTSLREVIVSAESMVNHRDSRMGIERVRINTISKIPSAFGEADVLKVVLTLPGVKSVGEASSGFNVRGGSADQNLVLFNDGTIYNPSHFFGLFSAFNTDVINDIELYKSSIPAEFGGRISSVLDVRGREGNSKKIQGSLGLGLLTSRFHVEGPIQEDRTTFIVGGRTTYSNWIFNLLPPSTSYSGGKASFSDLNASVTHRVDDKNTLQLYGYWSRDGFSFDGDTTFHYSNLDVALKWRRTMSAGTGMTLVAGYDRYTNTVDDNFNTVSAFKFTTGVSQGFVKAGFQTVINDWHTLSYGAQAILYDLNPGTMGPLSDSSLVEHKLLPRDRALESALYVSDNWKPGDKLSMDIGVRLATFNAFSPNKFYAAPELRASAKYSILDQLTVKAGFNSMNQYIHLISNTSSISPMDAWHLASAALKPQKGWQAAAGLYWTVYDNSIDLSLETYYKRVSHSLDYKSGAVLIMNEHLTDDLVETFGKAYGVEFMIKKTVGKLSGWLAYTYSRSLLREMQDRGVETINGGKWYNAPHDKPHDFKLVGNYKFTHRYSLSVNVDYSTGRPVTIPVAVYKYGGGYRLAYASRNGYRIPDYFRMDLALNIDPGHYLRKLTHMSMTIGVYNVTGRKNPYSVFYNTRGGTSIDGYMVSVFATPVPYINLNLKFG